MNQMVIGKNIYSLRSSQRMTQDTLSRNVHISRTHLSNIENGKSTPGSAILEAIANYFQVSMESLLSDRFNPSVSSENGLISINHLPKRMQRAIREVIGHLN